MPEGGGARAPLRLVISVSPRRKGNVSGPLGITGNEPHYAGTSFTIKKTFFEEFFVSCPLMNSLLARRPATEHLDSSLPEHNSAWQPFSEPS